jgi:hypothetical protein
LIRSRWKAEAILPALGHASPRDHPDPARSQAKDKLRELGAL